MSELLFDRTVLFHAVGTLATFLFFIGFYFQWKKVAGHELDPATPKWRFQVDGLRYSVWSFRALLEQPMDLYMLSSRVVAAIVARVMLLQYEEGSPSPGRIAWVLLRTSLMLGAVLGVSAVCIDRVRALMPFVEYAAVPLVLLFSVATLLLNIVRFHRLGTGADSFGFQFFVLVRWMAWLGFGAVKADPLMIAFFATASLLQFVIVSQFWWCRGRRENKR